MAGLQKQESGWSVWRWIVTLLVSTFVGIATQLYLRDHYPREYRHAAECHLECVNGALDVASWHPGYCECTE